MSKYDFSSDWFTNNIPIWEKELSKYKKRPTKFLEIGTYEGRSAIWALENILLHPKSHIFCVDTFQEGTLPTFKRNIKNFRDKVTIMKGTSQHMLKHPLVLKEQFDIIYIDADHHASHVLEDAILAFPLLKKGGLLIFDDYTYSKEHDNRCPKQGIDAFLNAYAEDIHVIYSKWQVVLQKRPMSRPKKPCKSEFYDY